MEFQIITLLVIGFSLAFLGGFLTWKNADFFLARRDYYVKSKFDLLKKKLSLSFGVAGTIIFFTIIIAGSLSENKKQKDNRTRKEIATERDTK